MKSMTMSDNYIAASAAKIALFSSDDGTARQQCERIVTAATTLEELVAAPGFGWGKQRNTWEGTCKAIADYLRVFADTPSREMIRGYMQTEPPKERPLKLNPEPDTRSLARSSDPETSHRAAREIKPSLPLLRFRVLSLLANGPLTDEALVTKFAATYVGTTAKDSSIRTRRSELVKFGYVIADGEVPNKAGRDVTLWKITPKGETELKAKEQLALC